VEDASIIYRVVTFHDAHLLNLVESMLRRLEDFLSREGNTSKY
jgi:hypothetical protein